jgi:hypothetical protein
VAKRRADRAADCKGRLLVRAWEKQKRGLAHLHGVIAVATPSERAWAKAYVEALRALAPRYGFGFVDGWGKIGRRFWAGAQAGAYLSSYLVGGGSRKDSIAETVKARDLPRLIVYVSPTLTRATGCTMRNLRHARALWMWRTANGEPLRMSLAELLVAAELLDRRPPRLRGP